MLPRSPKSAGVDIGAERREVRTSRTVDEEHARHVELGEQVGGAGSCGGCRSLRGAQGNSVADGRAGTVSRTTS